MKEEGREMRGKVGGRKGCERKEGEGGRGREEGNEGGRKEK